MDLHNRLGTLGLPMSMESDSPDDTALLISPALADGDLRGEFAHRNLHLPVGETTAR